MTIEQLKEAFVAGEQIQIRIDWLDKPSVWYDIDDPEFDYFADRYRIKPAECSSCSTPRPIKKLKVPGDIEGKIH